jgi:hypothetical protein
MDLFVANHVSSGPEICNTLYFWWIAYLRCSPDYWWICKEQGRCDDERLHKVWKHFGNVYDYTTLIHYWRDHAHRLFDSPQQQLSLDVDRYHEGIRLVEADKVTDAEVGQVYLSAFRHLSLDAALNAFQLIWERAVVSGRHDARGATLQPSRIDPKSRRTIVLAYCAHVLEDLCKNSPSAEAFTQWRNFEMARFLQIFGRSKSRPDDSVRTARRIQGSIRTLFGQKKRAAQQIIANVEIGIFPSRANVPRVRRWTTCQEKRRNAAISSGAWRPCNWIVAEHQFLLPHLDLSIQSPSQPAQPCVLTAVRNFSELDSSQLGKR